MLSTELFERKGETMDRAAARIQEDGSRLLSALYGALRALKLYPMENTAVQHSLGELHAIMERIVQADGGAELRIQGDFLSVE